MHGDILILGYGPVGKATAAALAGRPVRIAQRHRPAVMTHRILHKLCC